MNDMSQLPSGSEPARNILAEAIAFLRKSGHRVEPVSDIPGLWLMDDNHHEFTIGQIISLAREAGFK